MADKAATPKLFRANYFEIEKDERKKNRMKKFFAILLSAMLMLSLAVPAMATDITIDDGTITGATYQAYKLLNATNALDADGKATDKFAYTVNTKYASVLESVTGKTADADVVAYITAVTDLNAFANSIYAAIKAEGLDKDAETANNAFTGVDQGYYLIVETTLGTTENGATDTYSLLMLDTAGKEDITVKTKEDLPTVEKKVEEKNDSTTDDPAWGDSADYDVNDVINYKITGTVSDKYASYKSYYYSFGDTMADGLTMNNGSVKVTIDGVDVTNNFTVTYAEHGFTATSNLKELDAAREDVAITGGTEVIVTYTATLNENAVSGTAGNKNEVTLKYENDPYHEGDGDPTTPDKPDEPGETPKDTNIVFTYDVIVNKVDKDKKPLEGAGFTLYKWDADANGEDKWGVVGSEVKGDTLTTFEFEKLDEGKYKLVETTVPDGYNKADDIIFTIESTLTGESLTELVVKDVTGAEVKDFTVTVSSGKIETAIVNNAGTELPSTGGMGTTIFYTVGGLMVVAAVVLLVTKKRMSAEG